MLKFLNGYIGLAVSLCAYTGSASIFFSGVRVANPSAGITDFASGLTLLLNWVSMAFSVSATLHSCFNSFSIMGLSNF